MSKHCRCCDNPENSVEHTIHCVDRDFYYKYYGVPRPEEKRTVDVEIKEAQPNNLKTPHD